SPQWPAASSWRTARPPAWSRSARCGPVGPRSALRGEPEDGDLAVGLLRVIPVARRRGDHLRVRPLSRLALQALDRHLEPAVADLDPDLIGVLREVDEPGGVGGRSALGGDDQPAAVAV